MINIPERKVFVLREVEIEFNDLQKGDIFRLEKASPTDICNDEQYCMVVTEPRPHLSKAAGQEPFVMAEPIAFVSQKLYSVKDRLRGKNG